MELILSVDALKSSVSSKSSDTAKGRSKKRKMLFNIVRWSVFAIICLSVVAEGLSTYRNESVYILIKIISYCILTLVVIGIIVVMFLALTKFIWIVSQQ